MRIELLLTLIKHYANNPSTFILLNYIKSESSNALKQQIYAKKHDYIITQSRASETACAFTAQGLLTALTDPSSTLNKIPRVNDEILTADDFENLRHHTVIGGMNDINHINDFVVYQFSISGDAYQRTASGGHSTHSINHTFLIIQYRNQSHQICYCMLQVMHENNRYLNS